MRSSGLSARSLIDRKINNRRSALFIRHISVIYMRNDAGTHRRKNPRRPDAGVIKRTDIQKRPEFNELLARIRVWMQFALASILSLPRSPPLSPTLRHSRWGTRNEAHLLARARPMAQRDGGRDHAQRPIAPSITQLSVWPRLRRFASCRAWRTRSLLAVTPHRQSLLVRAWGECFSFARLRERQNGPIDPSCRAAAAARPAIWIAIAEPESLWETIRRVDWSHFSEATRKILTKFSTETQPACFFRRVIMSNLGALSLSYVRYLGTEWISWRNLGGIFRRSEKARLRSGFSSHKTESLEEKLSNLVLRRHLVMNGSVRIAVMPFRGRMVRLENGRK